MSAKLVGRILLTVGLVIAGGGGGYFFWSTQDFLKDCLRAQGKVVELIKPPTARYYTPVIQFETADHQTITASGKFGSNPPAHQVADTVTVLYRSSSPQDIRLDDPLELWFLTFLLGGMGSVFIIVGGALQLFSATRRAPG